MLQPIFVLPRVALRYRVYHWFIIECRPVDRILMIREKSRTVKRDRAVVRPSEMGKSAFTRLSTCFQSLPALYPDRIVALP